MMQKVLIGLIILSFIYTFYVHMQLIDLTKEFKEFEQRSIDFYISVYYDIEDLWKAVFG